jgi:magnesium chelatase subunit D
MTPGELSMTARFSYPFSAIVGQEPVKEALLFGAVHPALGGVLIRGEQGSAKSTVVRALVDVLPEIEVVVGCAFNCDPTDPNACDDCTARRALGPLVERARRPVPLVELPLGATPDRVLGSVDIEYAERTGVHRLKPGLFANAHRGILYVDEVNLLEDHLSDLLLDAAAMGENHLERDGISVSHPARFALIGTMNPQEGELRTQLADRFALTVELTSVADPAERAEVVRRRTAFEADPERFVGAWAPAEADLRERVARARELVGSVEVSDALVELVARTCATYQVQGLRADLAMFRAAQARAALAGRDAVMADDVRVAAYLALAHRRRSPGADRSVSDAERLAQVLGQAMAEQLAAVPGSGGA